MVISILIMVLGAVALTLFICEKVRKYSVKATIIKSIASFLFISLAVYCHHQNGQQLFGTFVIVALVFGLLGDIWLDFKYVVPEHEKTFTYAGFAVFGLGHILYITGIVFLYDISWEFINVFTHIILPILIGFALGTVNIFLGKPLKLVFGNYKWIVWLYGSILFSFAAFAFTLSLSQMFQNATFNMLLAGSLLFAISDLILSMTYFGENHEKPFDIISNAITYYAAQYVIAFSLFFL